MVFFYKSKGLLSLWQGLSWCTKKKIDIGCNTGSMQIIVTYV